MGKVLTFNKLKLSVICTSSNACKFTSCNKTRKDVGYIDKPVMQELTAPCEALETACKMYTCERQLHINQLYIKSNQLKQVGGIMC